MAENKKQYKIKVIQHLMKNNKLAKSGDIVSGSQFIDLQRSLKEGFCEEIKEETKKEVSTKAKKENEAK